jgi:hypothetical protein
MKIFLLQQRIGDGVSPDRDAVAHGEGLQMNEASRIDYAAGEFIGRQMINISQVLDARIDFRHQQRTLHRGLEARHQETMVTPRVGAGNRAAGIPAETVGHQPFAANRFIPAAADIATQRQRRDLCRT